MRTDIRSINRHYILAVVIAILFPGTAGICRGELWDTATYILEHGEDPVPNDAFDRDLPKAEGSVELKAKSKKKGGTPFHDDSGIDDIVSTTLKSDPNGLIIAFTPAATQVDMVTANDAAPQTYDLKLGGYYTRKGGGDNGGNGGGPKPLHPWEVDDDVLVTGSVGGVQIGNVLRGLGMPHSAVYDNSDGTAVTITFGENWPASQELDLEVINGNADNGEALLSATQGANYAAAITVQKPQGEDEITIYVKGITQTKDGDHAGNLIIEGTWDGGGSAQSAGFSVCAHPFELGFENMRNFYDEYKGTCAVGAMMDWDYRSDSGQINDLGKSVVIEKVRLHNKTGSFSNSNIGVNIQQEPETPKEMNNNYVDFNGHPAKHARERYNDDGVGTLVFHQMAVFSCNRCGMASDNFAAIPNSGYEITLQAGYTIQGPDGPVAIEAFRVTKDQASVSVDGYSTESGAQMNPRVRSQNLPDEPYCE
ncbi:MAG: hypothetical protein GVY24_06340 [Planctomycetes bacterium]|jgi:hypothetical protein|nr:hypothetical protein [Planctomycetota bacterium]